MTSFRRILLLALACAPLIMAADQLTGFPFQNETLRYRVIWPGGATEEWASVPVDRYTTLVEGSGNAK